eukprot:9316218-Alexandrium_andersonii.AAC.1
MTSSSCPVEPCQWMCVQWRTHLSTGHSRCALSVEQILAWRPWASIHRRRLAGMDVALVPDVQELPS